MNIHCVGVDRFMVTDVVRQTPFMICRVEDSDDAELAALADETRELTRNVLLLTHKLRAAKIAGEKEPELPEELSYWIAGLFDVPLEQQALIEMASTQARLER